MFFDAGVPGGPVHANTGEPSVVLTELHPEVFRRHPNVTWEFEPLQGDTDGYNSYLLRGASGTLPDISMLDGYWVAAFASLGYTTPMEDVLTTEQLDLYYPAFRNMYNGQTHGLVMDTAFNGVLWYRLSHIAEAGLTMPPSSMDELREYASILTVPGERSGFAMSMARTEATTVSLLGFYWAAQIPFLNDANEALFNNQTSVDIFEMLKGMYDDGSMPDDVLTHNYVDAERMFCIGMASMLVHGSWLANGWEVRAPDFPDDIGLSNLPPDANTGISSQNAGGWGLSVTTKDTEKYPAIADFISVFVLEPEWAILRISEGGSIPVTSNIPPSDVDWFPPQFASIIMDILPASNTRPIIEVYPDASMEYTLAMQETVMGVKDAQTALADAVERVAEIARESGWAR
jgi:ABC-type glycerol-3-phosphate transport system substrate-binding protein